MFSLGRYLLTILPFAAGASEPVLTFEKDVRPILKANCTHCHGEEEEPDGDVDLRLLRFMDVTVEDGTKHSIQLWKNVFKRMVGSNGITLGPLAF